jgi:glucosyl-3-phosphoglycerate synthase
MASVLVPMIRSLPNHEHDAGELAARKGATRITVCLPARDEAATVGDIVSTIRRHLVDGVGLVDEVLVMDDGSTDGTAAVAAAAGARVVGTASVLPRFGTGHGKGEALWKSLHVAEGDLIAWCDADIRDFDPGFVVGLLGPLLTRTDVGFVKGFYDRPVAGEAGGGGRVTELVARPLLSLLFPELASLAQPLAGEYAGRRELLEQLPFASGYGVDIALLIDIAERFGADVIAQVDLGVRVHRNRPLDELSPQATAVLHAALRRADPALVAATGALVRPDGSTLAVSGEDRPPLVSVPEHRPAGRTKRQA